MNPGTRLDHYEIVAKIGEGGMGAVYRATDTRLGRQVAVKVLPEAFAGDPDRLARFEQEARAAAALNHPHIAVLHDIGACDGTHYMVQELLQGSSLRQALEAGPLPMDRALGLGAQIAEALQAAHGAGIVHRDLKPENVFVTESGHAKVLDFGLAKLTEATGVAASATMSPTVLATSAGQIMGTAGYMAPEQVHGQPLDRRADLFALGCVLYEMVSGLRAFGGETVIDSLHAVTRNEAPPLRASGGRVPAELQRIVDKCLRKDPAKRYQHADDVAVDLRALASAVESGVAAGGADETPAAVLAPAPAAPARLVAVALLAAAATAAVSWVLLRPDPPAPQPLLQFDVPLPGQARLTQLVGRSVAISPDGGTLVVTVDDQLWARRMDGTAFAPLPGTQEPYEPTFSPNGRELVYSAYGEIRRVGLDGSPPISVTSYDGNMADGLYWDPDGFVYFGGEPGGIVRVPAAGGELKVAAPLTENAVWSYGPRTLPGGDWVMFTDAPSMNSYETARIVAQSMSTGEQKVLVPRGRDARYVPTGHLLWLQAGVLWAQRFDPARLELIGEPASLVHGIQVGLGGFTGAAQYDISDTGTLVYFRGTTSGTTERTVTWVDRRGVQEPLPFDVATFTSARLSPDGRRVAAAVQEGVGEQIWIYDIDRPRGQRLTGGTSFSLAPVWSPDGEWVYYSSVSAQGTNTMGDIWRKRADFSGEAELVYESAGNQVTAQRFSDDGTRLAFMEDSSGSWDAGVLTLGAEPEVEYIARTPAREWMPAISPDGRFVVYQSNESGTGEIYVTEIDGRRRWLISTDGGALPVWSRNGREISYNNSDGRFVVEVALEPEFTYGTPQRLYDTPFAGTPSVDYSMDSERFLEVRDIAMQASIDASSAAVRVVVNWFDELKARLPAGR